MRVNYYINNTEVHRPLNYAELSIELNYDKDDDLAQTVSLNEFEWGVGLQVQDGLADAAKLINDWREDGLTTGVGVFEGIPFRIEITHDSTTYQLFDGYLDSSKAIFDCDRIVIPSVEKGNVDWLNEVADSVSFDFLYDPKDKRGLSPNARITSADFLSIPYVLNSIPDNKEIVIATLSVAFLVDALAQQVEALIEFTAQIINPLEWTTIIRLILRIIYIAGLIFTLVKLIKRVFNLIVQPTKYHDGMLVKTLCEKGASHFGLNFTSSILNSNEYEGLTIIPKKYSHDVDTSGNDSDGLLGFLNPNSPDARGYYNGTFGELLRGLKEMFNAKIVIEGSTLRLESEDYPASQNGNYVLPPIDKTDFSLNFDDFKSNYVVEFQTDINDKNSINNYEGTITQVISQPVNKVNTDMVLMSGLESRNIPFARATYKITATTPERVISSLAQVFDPVAQFISDLVDEIIIILEKLIKKYDTVFLVALAPQVSIVFFLITGKRPGLGRLVNWIEGIIQNVFPNFTLGIDFDNLPKINYQPIGDLVKDRQEMLLMENDFIDIPKICLINTNNDNKLNSENVFRVNTEFLYNNYHKNRSFVLSNDYPNGNQYRLFNKGGIPFCFEDYELLRTNNKMQDDEGNNGKLISATWNVENQTCEMSFGINQAYTANIEETIITPDGK